MHIKKNVLLFLLLPSIFLSFACQKKNSPLQKTGGLDNSNQPVNITVLQGDVFLNDSFLLTKPWNLASFEKMIGSPTRLSMMANTVCTFDEHGLILFQQPGFKTIKSLTCFFSHSNFQYDPVVLYQSVLTIENVQINEKTSLQMLKDALPEYAIEAGILENSFRGASKGVYIYFTFTSNTCLSLSQVNIGYH